jgi:type II secretory ATPase GspE/PulE/Tfp pilus assembly ATPase PilB-like protein
VGCEACFNEGYEELSCVSEILQNSGEIEEAIATSQPAATIDTIAKQQGMLSLAETIATRVLRGETSLVEAQRCAPDPLFLNLERSPIDS